MRIFEKLEFNNNEINNVIIEESAAPIFNNENSI